jgi:hypothetical protein
MDDGPTHRSSARRVRLAPGFKDRFQALSLAESRLKVIGIMSTH